MTATRWSASWLPPTAKPRCPGRWRKATGIPCSRAWCRCWAASRASRRWTCPSPPHRRQRGTRQCPRPFEVIGIPLSPGFHVVEIASQKLGASLLDERHGAAPHDVRAHLGAGHQPGRSLQARPRKRAGLGDDARQGRARGRCAGARLQLPGRRAGQGHDRCAGHCAIHRPVVRAAALFRRRGRQRLLCQRAGHAGRHSGHGVHLERLAQGHRILALQPADQQRPGARHARPHDF